MGELLTEVKMSKINTVENVVVGVMVIVILYLIYQVYNGEFTAQFASAIGSLGLVAATLISLSATRTTVREQRKAREQEIRPALQLTTNRVSASGNRFGIKNIGNGPANDISITLTATPKKESPINESQELTFSLPNLSPNESVRISAGTVLDEGIQLKHGYGGDIEAENILEYPDSVHDDVLLKYSGIKIDGKCRDMFGNTVPISGKFTPMFSHGKLTNQMSRGEVVDQLAGIKNEISNIER
ncbi:hypothetical protein [Haloarcula sp. H-GB5]